jgi:hypothetical protein
MLALFLLAAGLWPAPSAAQESVPNASPLDYDAIRQEAQRPPVANVVATGAAESTAYATEEEKYNIWVLQHRQRSFGWHHRSGIIIFWTVMALIASGLFLSYRQFEAGRRRSSATSIKIGKDGAEISSEVIGLLILFFSLGFFYLYLTNVYPLFEMNNAAPPPG